MTELEHVIATLLPAEPATIPEGERLRLAYYIFNGRLPVVVVQRWTGETWRTIDWRTMKAWNLWWMENRPRTNEPMDEIPIAVEMLRRAGVVWEGELVEIPEPPRVTGR